MASDQVIVGKNEISSFLPQKEPFIMVDELIYSDEKLTTSSFFIQTDNIFCQDGLFREPGLIENIAQTAAARTGYDHITSGKAVPVGYIGALKNLAIHQLPAAGTRINTTISIDYEMMEISVITGKIYQDDLLLAQCEMKIFLK